ncbi:HSP20 family protein [Haladaptatus litoreus]|uniref:HSP20 family protein n=1 Tax=Haladaptatus litoreus TaxID=553468 RepID=A0A1N7C3B0_9EURY|nr:Hsp20/alpha crystallin family protein [Haladaptatus litoreus]SIR58057.1 HSP20 family protein [Haladaptatus litoreus]
MSRRKNPFDELEEMFERMGRQFDEMGGQLGGGMDWQTGGISVDVVDNGDEYVVTADLPGFEKDDLDITLQENRLRISAEHESEVKEEGEEYLRQERSQRSVSRTVSLPDPVDESSVSAEYRNGVLTVSLPKINGSDDSHNIEVS